MPKMNELLQNLIFIDFLEFFILIWTTGKNINYTNILNYEIKN